MKDCPDCLAASTFAAWQRERTWTCCECAHVYTQRVMWFGKDGHLLMRVCPSCVWQDGWHSHTGKVEFSL